MKYVTLSFHLYGTNTLYFVEIDNGEGLKTFETEFSGSFYPIGTKSPVKFVSDYCDQKGYEVIQIIEEEGYKHLRFYLRKLESFTGSVS